MFGADRQLAPLGREIEDRPFKGGLEHDLAQAAAGGHQAGAAGGEFAGHKGLLLGRFSLQFLDFGLGGADAGVEIGAALFAVEHAELAVAALLGKGAQLGQLGIGDHELLAGARQAGLGLGNRCPQPLHLGQGGGYQRTLLVHQGGGLGLEGFGVEHHEGLAGAHQLVVLDQHLADHPLLGGGHLLGGAQGLQAARHGHDAIHLDQGGGAEQKQHQHREAGADHHGHPGGGAAFEAQVF